MKFADAKIGTLFSLPFRPTHFFTLDAFARPAKPDEKPQWVDECIPYVSCGHDEATHLHGWNTYACFLSIERFEKESLGYGEYTKYGDNIVVGARVELSPHLDLWMQGARFGDVTKIQHGLATVKLDARPLRPAHIRVHDLLRR